MVKCYCGNDKFDKIGELKFQLFDDNDNDSSYYQPNIIYCKNCGMIRYDSINDNISKKDDIRTQGIIANDGTDDNKFILADLEHVTNLDVIFDNLKQIDIGQFLYVEVPYTNMYQYYGNPIRYFYPTHIYHFGLTHSQNLFAGQGFKIINIHISFSHNNLPIPYIKCMFKKIEKIEITDINNIKNIKNIKLSFSLANRIKNWFNNENYLSLDNNNILMNLALSEKVIYVWGIGIHTQMILGMSPLKNCLHRIYFVDSNKKIQEKTIAGKMIHDISILHNATNDDIVIIGSPTHSKIMYEQLVDKNKIGFKGQVIIIEFGNIRTVNQTI